VLLVGFCGCSSGNFDVAKVSGRVTCNGKPIQGGQILFRPTAKEDSELPGKSAKGILNDNGEFEMMTTYAIGDGAVVGTHTVQVLPEGYNVDEDDEDAPTGPVRRYPCIGIGGLTEHTIEIKGGEDNVLEIELTNQSARRRR
jgi:hypothetical protein